MEDYFSIGELSSYQNISKQTLIFYDKIGLFRPAYVDPGNGYRYYSASQLDELDTILIKELLEHYTTESSLRVLTQQVQVLDRQMEELRMVRSRLAQRCVQLERAGLHREGGDQPRVERLPAQLLLIRPVEPPFTLREISIATKQCFAQAFQENLLQLPEGLGASIYHRGDYPSIGRSYRRLLEFCQAEKLEIRSDSYEFCINDYITTGDESEYLTKIVFYVERKEKHGHGEP